MPKQIDIINAELSKAKARWKAKETPQSLFSDEQKKQLLGVIPNKEFLASVKELLKIEVAPKSVNYLPSVDWRNHNGNHVTPVKDQLQCGSCVSFACCALVESMASIEKNIILNLSEADSHFCSSHGANCNGWWPEQCLNSIISRGVCDEACFPYESAFPGPICKPCPNRDRKTYKITSKNAILLNDLRKEYLSKFGPLVACFAVYNDFFSYSGGVYHHVSGPLAGYHAILVIGYDENDKCWICKNSWGSGWGTGGFFKIAYGECQIDDNSFSPFYSATGVICPPTGFQNMGGIIINKPAVCQNADGRLEVFVRSVNNELIHIWQTAANNGWSGWASLGGPIYSNPVAIKNANGRIEVFAKGPNNCLKHIWQTAPNNGWSNWADLGGILTSDPAVVLNQDGRIEVFARLSNGALGHIWQTAPNNGWSGWSSFNYLITGNPFAIKNLDGRIEVFFKGINNALNHIWQTSPNNGWSSWSSLGGSFIGNPFAAMNADGRIEVFVRNNIGNLYHIWQTAPNNGWSNWSALGGNLTSDPIIGVNKDSRLEVFAKGTTNNLIHIWQTAPNNGWSTWGSLGNNITGDMCVGSNQDGRLEVFFKRPNLSLWHIWQIAPNNGWF